MTKPTRAYFGDGVYASFDGTHIVLQANGVGPQATDTIYLEPQMVSAVWDWADNGYVDHSTGRKFGKDQ